MPKWSYETRQLTPLPPAAFADVLYVPLAGGVLAAVSPQDGQLLWRSEAGGEFSAAPAADERGVYVGSELNAQGQEVAAVYTKGVVRALSRTSGVTIWTRNIPNPLEGALVSGDGLLFGASADGRIYALEKGTGAPAWITKTEHPFRSAPSVAEGRLILASDDGYLLIVNIKNGAIFGRYRTENSQAAPFSVSGKILYTGSAGGYVSALREAGGRLETLWLRRAGTSVQSLTSTPNGLLVTSRDNFVYFLSHRNGGRLWKKQMPGRVVDAPLVSSDSALFAILGSEVCVALSLADGRQVNTLSLGEGNSVSTPPLHVGPYVIVPTRSGLIAFAPSDTTR
ncbi:MAG TPA: PQQ-binding-like beta-propeller repeat protein [Pyrinomonadaceae bacterium]|nr:PQQ-binding-like beta-propeller repeat protein [Pyrinomonadaceae bacterium]